MRLSMFDHIRNVQENGGVVAIVGACDLVQLKAAGINIESLLVSEPDNCLQAIEIAETLVRAGGVDLIVIPPKLLRQNPAVTTYPLDNLLRHVGNSMTVLYISTL